METNARESKEVKILEPLDDFLKSEPEDGKRHGQGISYNKCGTQGYSCVREFDHPVFIKAKAKRSREEDITIVRDLKSIRKPASMGMKRKLWCILYDNLNFRLKYEIYCHQ